MTTHTVCYETLGSRFTGSGSARPDASFAAKFAIGDPSAVDANVIPAPIIPPSGYTSPPWIKLSMSINATADEWWESIADSAIMSQDGSAVPGGPGLIPHGGSLSLNSGRIAPRLSLTMNINPAGATTVEGVVQYAYRSETYQGLSHFCEFEEWPPNSNTDSESALRELLATFNQSTSSYTLGTDSSGNDVVVRNCAFAALAPEGFVYLRPEDLGNNSDQIPLSPQLNTADKYRFHPSVFYPAGVSKYIRAIQRQATDQTPLDSSPSAGPIGITSITSSITTSTWLVCLDGQYQIVGLTHPDGSDYRRPRDIWNNVWVPIIQGSPAQSAATIFERNNTIYSASENAAIGTRWQYATYFRCLPIAGANISQATPAV